jgi:hypothetical protein
MSDNVPITPGTGERVATREVQYSGETAQIQTVALATTSGANDTRTATDISETNPLPVTGAGELMEAIEALRFAVQSLTRSIGMALPGAQGWPIMEVRQATGGNLSVGTVTTLTNQAQIGGVAANDYIPVLMRLGADNLRRNISVT